MNKVYIGLGSNEGDRFKNLQRSLQLLSKDPRIELEKVSSIYETEPVGYKRQNKFLNAVCEVSTSISPYQLLDLLKNIEKKMGRKKTFKWGPRNIDLDILLFDALVIDENGLHIPHKELDKRKFVLLPLCEIAPGVVHPVLKTSIRKLLLNLNKSVIQTVDTDLH